MFYSLKVLLAPGSSPNLWNLVNIKRVLLETLQINLAVKYIIFCTNTVLKINLKQKISRQISWDDILSPTITFLWHHGLR